MAFTGLRHAAHRNTPYESNIQGRCCDAHSLAVSSPLLRLFQFHVRRLPGAEIRTVAARPLRLHGPDSGVDVRSDSATLSARAAWATFALSGGRNSVKSCEIASKCLKIPTFGN